MSDNDFSPEQRAELGDLQPLYQRLQQYAVPEPDSARLLAALTPLLAEHSAAQHTAAPLPTQRGFRAWLRLAWAQTALLEAPFWWSSILLTLIGLFLGFNYSSVFTMVCLIFLSPLLAVGGVAYIFRPATRTLWELERLSHVQPLELLYARLALILLLNIGMAVVLLLAAWTQSLHIILWRLLLIWFGPMVGLAGLALFCSVRWNVVAGVVAPMTAWFAIIALGWREIILNTRIDLWTSNMLVAFIDVSNVLLLISIIALVAGIVLFYEAGRWVTKWH
jgi:hypothetical protein